MANSQSQTTLEDLATAIQHGGREQLTELIRRTDRWAWRLSIKYTPQCALYGGVDLDDLHQAALIGILAAVDTFSPERGGFLTWATYYMRKEIREALGIRSSKERVEYHCRSLDAPLSEDGGTLADLLPDVGSVPLPEHVATQDVLRVFRQAIEEAEADLVEAVLFRGCTMMQLAEDRGTTREDIQRKYNRQMRKVRYLPAVRRLQREYDIDQATPWYLHKGKQAAQWESSTERVAMIRERIRGGL